MKKIKSKRFDLILLASLIVLSRVLSLLFNASFFLSTILFFGMPGLILFSLGLFSALNVYLDFYQHGVLAIGNALITMILIVLGTLSGMTGLILHAVINANIRR